MMKRIINSSLFLLVMLLVTVLFAPSMFAAEPTLSDSVEVTLTAAFKTGNVVNVPIEGVTYGQEISIDDFGPLGSYVFDFWIVNGVVREDLAQETTFFATDDMALVAVFHPADNSEFYTVFVDSNGKITQQGFINANASVVAPASSGHDKPGYVVSGTPWRSVKGNPFGVTITQASVFELSYTIDSEATFTIAKPSEATISNATPLYNEIVTVESTDVDFVAWLENGQVVSYDPVYKFTALRDRTLSYTTVAEVAVPVVSLQVLDGAEELRSGYTSYLGQVYLPAGASLIEWGLVGSDTNSMPTYGGEGVTLSKSSVIHPITNEFLRSIPDANDFNYVRAYAVVKVGEVISTVYSYLEEEVVELPKLPTPVNGGNVNTSTTHIGIGVYGATPGYGNKLGLLFTNTTTNVEYYTEINAPANIGYAYHYNQMNPALPIGNYTLHIRAIAATPNPTHQNSDYMFFASFTISPTPISNPSGSIDNETGILTWGAVANAASYNVKINETTYTNVNSPYDLNAEIVLQDGQQHDITLYAIGATGYANSSQQLTYTKPNPAATPLTAPVIELNGNVVSWTSVENAESYVVLVDEQEYPVNVSNTSLDLSTLNLDNGTYDVYVIAIGDNIEFADSVLSNMESYVVVNALQKLNAMTQGDQNGNIGGYNDGYYNFVAHMGHAVFNQTGFTGQFRFTVRQGSTVLNTITAANGYQLHSKGSSSDFYGSVLVHGQNYTLDIVLIGDGTTRADSLPFSFNFTYNKG